MHKNKKPKARNPVVRGMLAKPSRATLKHNIHRSNIVRPTRKGARDVSKI